MERTYRIPIHVHGELRLVTGPAAFEYEPGEHTPADDVEAEVFEHLVNIGAAEVVLATKSAKRPTMEA